MSIVFYEFLKIGEKKFCQKFEKIWNFKKFFFTNFQKFIKNDRHVQISWFKVRLKGEMLCFTILEKLARARAAGALYASLNFDIFGEKPIFRGN